uniref:Erbb2 interacting protein n=1 Tax=Gasterosteus aculeatus aculeatus TaxID=481459 RepID=A0AAQ4Q409_GASAC
MRSFQRVGLLFKSCTRLSSFPPTYPLFSLLQCLRMSKRSFFVRLVPCRCLRGEEEAVTSLDYSHCSLETVPKEIFSFEKTLQELYLDANQIEELPKQLFNCQLLHRLSMPDNDVTVLPAAIANLVNLRELDVSKNSIQEFPENIKNCKVLAIVEASVNPISKLPDGFTQLLSLTQLYLNDAFLEFLPASFGRLTKLQILELRENQLKMLPKLTFLPGMVGTLKQLVYLDVSKNNLEMVDEQICGCENLQDLLLSNNALTQLPGSIGSLKKLTALKVDENQLIYLPDSVGGLASLDELDCSFNEIEALPTSIGQCVSIRTFAADHNFLSQLPPEMGNWKNATVLFLHSNKLESLPEEMGDMQKLKVINLSNNKLRNLPYSFTKLNQMTAMWLSENQSKPLIPLQKEADPETGKTMLTNYMFPQQTRTEEYIPSSDSESFNPALWEEQRKQRAQVAFECDEDKDERETPPREGNLKRYPTPYPDELKNMVKTAQSVAHRLKEDESGDESGKDAKPTERNHIGVQDVGVKVETKDTESYSAQRIPLKSHCFCLQDSDELSDEEAEMKIAEMRPPLIEISINQPKVVTLSKDKKDDADSLLDDTVANSNQNNSNCSSPSRMSDSVSLTTDSSQDNSLCTPEREAKMPFLPKSRFLSLLNLLSQQTPTNKMGDYDLSLEARLAFIEKRFNNGVGESYTKWDQINMNVSKPPTDNMVRQDEVDKTKNGSVHQGADGNRGFSNHNAEERFLNGNQPSETGAETPAARVAVAAGSDASLSRSTEELSPDQRCHPPPVVKCHSVGNIEAGGMKVYSFDGDEDSYKSAAGAAPGAQGQSIVRSRSASQLLNDQTLQIYPGSSASSSDLLSSSKPPASTSRYPVSSSMAMGVPPPQYNIQYASSGVPKEGLWSQRTPVPPEHQGYPPPPPHSLANTNYSNRNQAPPYPQQRGPPAGDMWTKERLHSAGGPSRSGTLQRQSSTASTASVASMSDPRRVQLPDDYMTYRDIHTLARGPLAMSHAMQRPLSARTYSIDAPASCRPLCSRAQPHELPERTMSVSDFNYQQSSPSKRPNARVKSEHSLLDGQVPGAGRVPSDWRDQVMRHIEAKKMEKSALSRSYNPGSASSHYGSCRDMHASQGSLVFSARDGAPYGAGGFCIRVKVEKNPELGFSISGGVGGRGNPFRPDDNGIFVTRVQPEGPASMILQPGDKILQANGYSFVNIDHLHAVSLLKTFPNTVDMIIVREAQA